LTKNAQANRPSVAAIAAFFAVNAVLHLTTYAWMTPDALELQGISDAPMRLTHGWTAAIVLGWAVAASAVFAGLRSVLNPRPLRIAAIVVATFALAVMAADCHVFAILGVRLDDYFVVGAFTAGGIGREAQLGVGTHLSIAAALTVGLGVQWWLFGVAQRSAEASPRALAAVIVVIVCIFGAAGAAAVPSLSAALQSADPVLDALPLRDTLLSNHTAIGHIALRHPATAGPPDIKLAKKQSVVFLLVESLRGDHATPELMPHMYARAKDQNCLLAPNHHSGGHATSWGVFSYLYALNSYHFLPFARRALMSTPLQALKANGYELVGVSGSKLRGWDNCDFMLDNFDTYKEFTSKKGHENDADVVKWLARWSDQRDKSKPFALFVFIVSPHHNYHYPPEFERHKPVMPENYNHFMDVKKLAAFKDKIVNRYKNAVLWSDQVFADIMTITDKAAGATKPIVALGGDHGEEFWDHGLLGHGAPRFYNARTRVPLLMCVPGRKLPVPAVSSHVDVWPTILAALEPTTPFPASGWSNGISLLHPHTRESNLDRDVVVTGVGYPYHGSSMALIGKDDKLWLERDGDVASLKVTKRLTIADKEVDDDPTNSRLRVNRLRRQMRRFLRTDQAVSRTEPPVQHRVDAMFGPWIRLVGFDLDTSKATKGGSATIRWVFECKEKVPKHWQLFVHLRGNKPNVFANLDHKTVDGSYTFEKWQPGEFIVDEHSFAIPRKARPGQSLALHIGLWAPGKKRPSVRVPAPFKLHKNALIAHAFKVAR